MINLTKLKNISHDMISLFLLYFSFAIIKIKDLAFYLIDLKYQIQRGQLTRKYFSIVLTKIASIPDVCGNPIMEMPKKLGSFCSWSLILKNNYPFGIHWLYPLKKG